MYDTITTDTASLSNPVFIYDQNAGHGSKFGGEFHEVKKIETILPPQRYFNDFVSLEFAKQSKIWARDTRHLSDPTEKYLHPSYARIIGLGWPVVPLILDRLEKNPDDWFYALRAITGANPVKRSMSGNMPKMINAWLLWKKRRSF